MSSKTGKFAKNDDENKTLIEAKEEKMKSFDTLLDEIGFGKYQLKLYLFIGLLGFSEGAQISVMTLMIPIVSNQWKISQNMNSLQASLIFISILFGSLISGQIADRYGRKFPALISCFLVFLFSFSSSFAQNIESLMLLRILMGLVIGCFAPLGATMLAELTPKSLRGLLMSILTVTLSFGQFFGMLIGYFVLDNLSNGNWRALIFYCSLPGLITWILGMLILEESPRYVLMVLEQYEKGWELIQKINQDNGNSPLSQTEKEKLLLWAKTLNSKSNESEEIASVKSLFSEKNKVLTLYLWLIWFISMFIYYGIVIFTPFILEKISSNENRLSKSDNNLKEGGNDIIKLLFSCLSEIGSVFFAAALIEKKSFGRKNSMIIFFCTTGIISIMTLYFSDQFIFFSAMTKFSLALTIIFLYQFTSEAYPTRIRTTGIGMASGIGKIGAITMPWICASVVPFNIFNPFLIFAGLAFLAAISSHLLPFDTRGRELDDIKKE